MKLPNVDAASVPRLKITGYLLSKTHRDGRHKAAFFLSFGFTARAWQTLAEALLKHAADHPVARSEETSFGMRYVVEGTMSTPDGRTPRIRSVWFIDIDNTAPRFVTAYRLEGASND